MRILLVVHGFPPSATGGTEIYVRDLAVRLAEEDGRDEVFVLAREARTDRPELSVRHERVDGLQVTYVNNTFAACSSFAQTYRNEAVRRAAGALLDEVRPEVAHVHHLTGLTTDLLDELRARAIPVAATLNDYWLLCQRGQLLDLELERCPGPEAHGCAHCLHLPRGQAWASRAGEAMLRLRPRLPAPVRGPLRRLAYAALAASGPDAGTAAIDDRTGHVRAMLETVELFLAPSRTLRERFLRFGIPADRMVLAEQGIEHRPFAGLRRTEGERLRVGFVGSLIVSKGPHVLLEAVAGLAPERLELRVYGAYAPYHGDDRDRARLAHLLAAPGVSHLGPLPHASIPAALAGLDVLAVPSVWIENAPFVIKEAFLAGVVVVASDLGGMAEMVKHERSGLLFPAGDASALRRALARLCDDPGLLSRLRAGLPPVKSMEQDARETRARYEELRGRGRAAARPA